MSHASSVDSILSLDDAEMDLDRIAGAEIGDVLDRAQLGDLFLVDLIDNVHGSTS